MPAKQIYICDSCGNEIERIEFKKGIALKVYCGSGCHDYFCDEDCQNEFIVRGGTYIEDDDDDVINIDELSGE